MTYEASNGQPLVREEGPSGLEYVRRFGPATVVAVAALLFVVQNTDEVTFNFLWFEFRWPLWIILVAAMLAGAIVFWALAARRRRRKRRREED